MLFEITYKLLNINNIYKFEALLYQQIGLVF